MIKYIFQLVGLSQKINIIKSTKCTRSNRITRRERDRMVYLVKKSKLKVYTYRYIGRQLNGIIKSAIICTNNI